MKPKINLLFQRTITSISKKFVVAAIALCCVTASAFASGDEANEKAANSLKAEYKNAKDVQWKVTKDYIKASFYWNGQRLEVFYNKQGETIAQGRLIKVTNLPLKAQQYLDDRYSNYTVTEAVEYNSDDTGLCYYVSVEKDSKKKILQISSDGDVSIFKN